MLPKKTLLLLLIAIILIAASVWVGSRFLSFREDPADPSAYSAVYLTSGDIYFGKLDLFPWPRLENVWVLQRSLTAQNQPQLTVVPFKSAFWGPVDKVYLSPLEILLWTHLRNDSQMARALSDPSLLNQPSQFPLNVQGPPGPPPDVQQPTP